MNLFTDNNIEVSQDDCFEYLNTIEDESVDLVLTDPPYTISRKTNFSLGVSTYKEGYKYSLLNKEFGEWDKKVIDLSTVCNEFYRVLRDGGTAIIWYDLWKITNLHTEMTNAGFSYIRLIIWQKTITMPVNSKVNYLTNSREIAVLGVKGKNATFNSEYDKGIYEYPLVGRGRHHPTQKPLLLFRDLIRKHSNEGDLVIDPFLGSGTTAVAANIENRRFKGCEKDEKWVKISKKRIFEGK